MRELPVLNKAQQKKLKKMNQRLIWGSMHKKVYPYPNALIDVLRPYEVGGLPVSILLLITELCNGLCYDRSILMSLAFNDAKVVHGNIETLRITTGGEEYAEHSFVETKEFGGGKTWVVDTSIGLIYDKDFYYDLEKVSVNCEISKETIMNSPMVKEIIAGDFEKDKYALPLYLPFIEYAVPNSKWYGTNVYKDIILRELKNFKDAINYDAIVSEIEEDMKLMYKDPQKLDEKFQIVRDKYGREISRGGVPNPYYISPEKLDEFETLRKDAEGNKEKLNEYYTAIFENSLEQMQEEEKKVTELAKIRLEEILKNPTANFYDKTLGGMQPNNG